LASNHPELQKQRDEHTASYHKAGRRATFKAIAFAGYSYVSKSTYSLGITGNAHLSFKFKRRHMVAVSRKALRAS
jgi:hypothetical protein